MVGVTASKQVDEDPARFEVKSTADSHFAWLRTRLSLERTLMSWVRTAVALIGFGFTIVQFFERVSDLEGVKAALRPQAPRYLGLALIITGVVSLAISVWQYRRVITYLSSDNFRTLAGIESGPEYTPLYAVSIVLMFIGLFAFFAVFTRAL
jgi:putative membrane protein